MNPLKMPQKCWGAGLVLGAEMVALVRGTAAGRQVGRAVHVVLYSKSDGRFLVV